jgi:hypothetical protein
VGRSDNDASIEGVWGGRLPWRFDLRGSWCSQGAYASRLGSDGRSQPQTRAVRGEKSVDPAPEVGIDIWVMVTFAGPCAAAALTSRVSVFSYNFKRLEKLPKLATS